MGWRESRVSRRATASDPAPPRGGGHQVKTRYPEARSIMRAVVQDQLSVFLKNRPGILADLCETLCRRDIHVRAMTVLESFDIGTVRMICDNVTLAEECLAKFGASFIVVRVLVVEIANRPGSIAAIARTLAGAGINIEYLYASASPGSEQTLGVLRIADRDFERALALDFPDEV